MKKENLFQKLIKRLKLKNPNMVKRLAALVMSGAIAVTMTGCSLNLNEIFNNSTPSIESSDSTNDPTDPNETIFDEVKSRIDKPDVYKDNSQILQNIVASEYYDDLILGICQREGTAHYVARGDYRLCPMPYATLLELGYTESQLSTIDYISSNVYIQGNKMYLPTTFHIPGNSYVDQYLFSCDVTDLEISDFIKLRDGNFIEHHFFIQELSKTRELKIEYSSHYDLTKYKDSQSKCFLKFGGRVVSEQAKQFLSIENDDTKCLFLPLYTENNPENDGYSYDFIYCLVMPDVEGDTSMGIVRYYYTINDKTIKIEDGKTIYTASLQGANNIVEDSRINVRGLKHSVSLYALPNTKDYGKIDLEHSWAQDLPDGEVWDF